MEEYLKNAFLRYQRKNKILFNKNDYIIEYIQSLLNQYDRPCITLWALTFAQEMADYLFSINSKELQFLKTVDICKLWAQGKCKMPIAKKEILISHQLANDYNTENNCFIHALAQGCSACHTIKHAIGYPIYELSGYVYKYGFENVDYHIKNRIKYYEELLIECDNKKDSIVWAKFITNKKP